VSVLAAFFAWILGGLMGLLLAFLLWHLVAVRLEPRPSAGLSLIFLASFGTFMFIVYAVALERC
jgi:hypothetical protein